MHQYQFQPQIETNISSNSSSSQSGMSNLERMHQVGMRQFVFPADLVLQRGSHGSWVTMLQQALLSKDLQCTVDGVFGMETEVVLRNFQRLNRLDVDGVAGGDTLRKLASVAPTGQSETATEQASAEQQASADQQTEPQSTTTEVEHRVFPGESLWKIAQEYYGDGGRWRELAQHNGLSNASVLKVGQIIRVPNVQQAAPATSAAPAVETAVETSNTPTAPEQESAPSNVTEHRVFPGESLWQIAQQYYGNGGRWREIADFNGLSSASVLKVGQLIRIPNTTASTAPVVSETPASQSGSGAVGSGGQSDTATTTGPSANGSVDAGGMAAPDPIPLAGLSGLRRSMAQIYNDKGSYLRQKATQLGITASAAAAVLHVESGGRGFSSSTGDMIIRFENHIFWDQWGKANPEQFREHFSFSSNKRWTGHRFRANPNDAWESFHGNQALEWRVLNFARDLSDTGALNSISMGAAQIMGFNSKSIGYDSVQEMFEAMTTSLPAQLDGMFSFIEQNGRCMRGLRNNDFVTFASGYNGSGQAETYGGLISAAESAFRAVTASRTQA